MLFDTWHGLLRVIVVSALAYLALIGVLRLAGKRALTKLNIFGLVVTVAFGSTFATVLLNKDVSLAEGALAFAMLALLQSAIARASISWSWAEALFRSSPRLLLYRGTFDLAALRDQRITEGEVRQAVRANGCGSLADVAAVVLETDGSFTVIRKEKAGDETSLCDVEGYRQAGQ